MTLTIEERITRYLSGPKHYREGLDLLIEVSKKRKLLMKMIAASTPRDTSLYKFFRTKIIYELELYMKGPRKRYLSVTDWTDNFHH